MKLYEQGSGREVWHEPWSPSVEDELFADPPPDPPCTHEQLWDALEHLTDRQRFCVKLYYGLNGREAFTQREIAELAGWHLATVQEHLERAQRRLRRILDEGK